MDASFELRTTNGHKRILKFAFLPNGEVHADLVAVGGYRSPGGAVYKCSNWYKNKIIDTSSYQAKSKIPNSTRNSSSNLSQFSDWKVCDESKMGKQQWLQEAKSRGLNCGVSSNSSTSFLRPTDEAICNMATDGYPKSWRKEGFAKEYVLEAKLRGLNCGVNDPEAEKKKIAKEKARQERIKAEQERIKKRTEELARKKRLEEEKAKKKKLAEEKARKIAEKKAKKEAEIKAKKLAQEKLKIKNAKKESVGFYKDIISYVKTANDIDLVQLSELFENKPKPTQNWNIKDLKDYEKLKTFISKSLNFREFHTKQKEKRAKAKLNLKLATIDKLEDNLNNFEIILKENFGNNKITKLIRQYIEKTKKTVSDDKYEQNLADKILLENETYLVTYKMNKNKLNEVDTYLNATKNELSQILKNNFGSTKGNKASKYLKNIEYAKNLTEKTELKNVIERFLKQEQIDSAQKQKSNKTTSNLSSLELSNVPDNIICNRVYEGNTDYLFEAKRRGLSCAASVASNQNTKVTPKNLSKKQAIIKPPKKLSEEELKKVKFENSLAANQKYIERVDFKALAEKHVKETELQNERTEKELKNKYISITGTVAEVDRKGSSHGYTQYLLQVYEAVSFIDGLAATCGTFYAKGNENSIIESLKIGDSFTMSGQVRSYGDWVGLQLQYCSIGR